MKAVLMTSAGGVETLELRDIDTPQITESSQIKVKLHAAGVNPIDTKLRQRGVFFPDALPAILGCDGAGEVVETGTAVTRFKVGDRVWFCHGGLGAEPGNYAEYTVLDQRWAAAMPASIDFISAAAGPLVLLTAWGALFDRGRLQRQQTVLIHAGAGGVGHVAIQLAKWRGATVITTAGNDAHLQLCRTLGADYTINHNTTDFVQAVNDYTHGVGVDLALDTVGPDIFGRSVECTRHFGDLVTILEADPAVLKEARMRNLRIGYELMLTPQLRKLDTARDHQTAILQQCAGLIDQGLLKLHVGQILPLSQADAAHIGIETGRTTGKRVLRIVD